MTPSEIAVLKNKSAIDLQVEKNCLPVAVIFGMALLEPDAKKRTQTIRSYKRYENKLNVEVDKIIQKCNLNLTGKHGIEDLVAIQEKFPEYRIRVYCDKQDFRNMAFCGQKTARNFNKIINLFYSVEDNHFFV